MGDLTASGTSIWATRRLPRTTWKWWGLMVRDGACAPPHHEGRTVCRLWKPHPEERAWRASPDDASHRL